MPLAVKETALISQPKTPFPVVAAKSMEKSWATNT